MSPMGGCPACSINAAPIWRWACRSTCGGRRCSFACWPSNADLEPGELVWMGGDVHLYLSHGDLVEAQMARQPDGAPRMEITRRPATIFDYTIEDFSVVDYAQGKLSAPVAV
jgi:hypothetical protein